ALVLAQWGCEDIVPGGPGTTTTTLRLSGTVSDLLNDVPIYQANVTVTADGRSSSILTNSNGQFVFELTRTTTAPVYVQLTAAKHANLTAAVAFNMGQDTTIGLNLNRDLSTSATISGVVRDSTTLFPLRGTSILFAVPGFVDSVITSVDGAFTYTLDLVDRDSMPVILTFAHPGFQTKQAVQVVHKGQSNDLGNVLLFVDRGSSVGQIQGRVFDSQ